MKTKTKTDKSSKKIDTGFPVIMESIHTGTQAMMIKRIDSRNYAGVTTKEGIKPLSLDMVGDYYVDYDVDSFVPITNGHAAALRYQKNNPDWNKNVPK